MYTKTFTDIRLYITRKKIEILLYSEILKCEKDFRLFYLTISVMRSTLISSISVPYIL